MVDELPTVWYCYYTSFNSTLVSLMVYLQKYNLKHFRFYFDTKNSLTTFSQTGDAGHVKLKFVDW